jgi:hypothetical protein
MLGMDRSDDEWDASDATPDTPQFTVDAAHLDRGTVLRDADARREYALAYRAKAWVPQLDARMVIRIWPVSCENSPDSGTRRVYLGARVPAGQRGARLGR